MSKLIAGQIMDGTLLNEKWLSSELYAKKAYSVAAQEERGLLSGWW